MLTNYFCTPPPAVSITPDRGMDPPETGLSQFFLGIISYQLFHWGQSFNHMLLSSTPLLVIIEADIVPWPPPTWKASSLTLVVSSVFPPSQVCVPVCVSGLGRAQSENQWRQLPLQHRTAYNSVKLKQILGFMLRMHWCYIGIRMDNSFSYSYLTTSDDPEYT